MDASARQQRDPLVAEEPARALGRVPGIGVLRKQADERALTLLVERREQQRQRGLGDARRRRQRLDVGGEALLRKQLLDERVQHRPGGGRVVHDERRNRRVPLLQSVAPACV